MERFAFSNTLAISFSAPVTDHRFRLRLTPMTDSRQRVISQSCTVAPHAKLWQGSDSFGSTNYLGVIDRAHNAFLAEGYGIAETDSSPFILAPEGPHPMYAHTSPLTAAEGELAEFIAGLELSGSIRQQTAQISQAVHRHMSYTPGATAADTAPSAAFAMGRGVCQDYVQICLAALRSRGLYARYAAGLIPGVGESHAWLEVYTGDGWYCFDPTNNCEIGVGCLKLTHGRDSADCFLNRGIFRGGTAAGQSVLALITKE